MLNVAIEELPSYEIGMEKGLEKGLEKGVREGVEQGLRRGTRQTAEALFLRLFEARFGPPDAAIRARIRVASAEQIMDWSEALLSVAGPGDLFE